MNIWSKGSTLALSVAVVSCSTEADEVDAGPPPTLFEQVQTSVFRRHCAAAPCHDMVEPGGELSLTPNEAYGELVNVPAAQDPGLLRVTPGDPSASYLWIKLGSGPFADGVRMPSGEPTLPDEDLSLIREWIEAGALP